MFYPKSAVDAKIQNIVTKESLEEKITKLNEEIEKKANKDQLTGNVDLSNYYNKSETGFIRSVVGSNIGGFIPSSQNGASETTYFCATYSNYQGHYSMIRDYTNIFTINTNDNTSNMMGSRLMYIKYS